MSTVEPFNCFLIGTGSLMMRCADLLLSAGHRVEGVISADAMIQHWAETHCVECYGPEEELLAVLSQWPFDYLFSITNDQILSEAVLNTPRRCAVNYHDAPLPRYAGVHATSWALIHREPQHGISWHVMSPRVDAGAILIQRQIPIEAGETALTLNAKCYEAAYAGFVELIDALAQGRELGTPQDAAARSFFPRHRRPDRGGVIAWSQSAEEIDACVRALEFGPYENPLGRVKLFLGREYCLFSSLDHGSEPSTQPPGTVIRMGHDFIQVATSTRDVLLRDLMTLEGQPLPVAAAAARFSLREGQRLPELEAEFATRLAERSGALSRHEGYWRERLAVLRPCALPYLKEQPEGTEPPASASATMPIPPAVLSLLAGRWFHCQQDAFLLAAFAAYLVRIAGTDCFDMGFRDSTADRGLAGLEQLFADAVPIRVEIERNQSFHDLFLTVCERAEEARRHHSYLRDLVVRSPSLRCVPELRREHPWTVSFDSAGTTAEAGELTAQTLTLLAPRSGGECRWVYAPERLERQALGRMMAQFTTFLEAVVAGLDRPVETLPVLSHSERHEILVGWNRTASPYPRDACVHELLQAQAARTPELEAVIGEEGRLTYGELNRKANQLGHYLRGLGLEPEARVGVCLDRSSGMVAALLGILKAGGAYVPLDPGYPADRLAFMLADSQVSVLLTETRWRDALDGSSATMVCLDEIAEAIDQQPTTDLDTVTSAGHLAYVMYTSGSTGTPKGVGVVHRGIVRLVRGTEFARMTPDEVFLHLAPLSFDASTFEIWGALLNGARLALFPARTPALDDLGEALRRYRVTTLWLTAGLFHQVVDLNPEALRPVRQLLAGGDVLSPPHVLKLTETLPECRLINGYGPTENTTFSCCYSVPSSLPAGSPVPIGTPIANSEAYVLDAHMQVVPAGVAGELYLGGDGLARGYLNHPDLTAEKFVPHPFSREPGARLYRTGDEASYRADGVLEFLGRLDRQVKIRGFRIEPGEIETTLSRCPGVRHCAVVAGEQDGREKRLVAYLVPAGERHPEANEVRQFLQARLPDYMVPSAYVFLDALPLTSNGKLDLRALPAPDWQRAETPESFVAPRTSTEAALASIWAEVLGHNLIGVDDNFFELGGDSILSIQIAARSHRAGLRLSPQQVFQHPTVAALAAVCGRVAPNRVESEVVAGPVPLTPIQRWFFEQRLVDIHHYNQAILVEVPTGLNAAVANKAVRWVFAHHDGFRLRYACENGIWRQFFADTEEVVSFAHVDLSGRSPSEQQPSIDAAIAEAQTGLDPAAGPLARVAYFDLGAGRPGRLLLVVHHLVIDGVSWRILLEDLQRALRSLAAGGAGFGVEPLSRKTTSYQAWSRRLAEHTRSNELLREAEFWLAGRDTPDCPLPRDFAGGTNTVASERSVRVSLSAHETRGLLHHALAAHGAQINDLLLAALSHAMAAWTGGAAMRVDVEGHGREAIVEDVDLSRTVGWFTSIYPVRLDLDAARGPCGALPAIKEELRRIPNRGIGYGLLRYLCEEPEIAGRMRALTPAEVSFNYLGQFDQLFSDGGPIGGVWEWCGGARSPRQNRSHLLAIDGQIQGGRLEMVWSYSAEIHRRETIERPARAFMDALRSWIEAASSVTGPDVAADFPDVELSAEKLELVFAELGLDAVPAD